MSFFSASKESLESRFVTIPMESLEDLKKQFFGKKKRVSLLDAKTQVESKKHRRNASLRSQLDSY